MNITFVPQQITVTSASGSRIIPGMVALNEQGHTTGLGYWTWKDDSKYRLTHLTSGLQIHEHTMSEGAMQNWIADIASITDWTATRATIDVLVPRIAPDVRIAYAIACAMPLAS